MKTLNDLAAKYRYTELTVISMVQGLDTFQYSIGVEPNWRLVLKI